MTLCPCGSNINYENCCEPYHLGKQYPQTPEQLMRSRYSAYAKHHFDYIEATMKGSPLRRFNKTDTIKTAPDIIWEKLEVLDAPPIQPQDTIGFVEFKAHYHIKDETHVVHERSRFTKIKDKWFYLDGIIPQTKASIQGRNDPCACGSGKKFKKCCGIAIN